MRWRVLGSRTTHPRGLYVGYLIVSMRLVEPLQPLLANRDGYMCRTDDRNQSFDGTVDGRPNCPGRAVNMLEGRRESLDQAYRPLCGGGRVVPGNRLDFGDGFLDPSRCCR